MQRSTCRGELKQHSNHRDYIESWVVGGGVHKKRPNLAVEAAVLDQEVQLEARESRGNT